MIMPLINCPECKNQISDLAQSCPSCGYPIKSLRVERAIENEREKLRILDSPGEIELHKRNLSRKEQSSAPEEKGQFWLNFFFLLVVTSVIVLIIVLNKSDKEDSNYSSNNYSQNNYNISEVKIKYSIRTLNVREKPDVKSKVLKTLKLNEKVLTNSVIQNGFITVLKNDSSFLGWGADKYLQDSPLSKNQIETLKEKQQEQEKLKNETTSKQRLTENKTTGKQDLTKKQSQSMSLSYGLALIEKNGYVSEDDVIVKRFDYLLKQLDKKYLESETQICDMSTVARQKLKDSGINATFLEIMEGMNRLNDPNDYEKLYPEYVTLYIVLRKTIVSHTETIDQMQNAINIAGIDYLLKNAGIK